MPDNLNKIMKDIKGMPFNSKSIITKNDNGAYRIEPKLNNYEPFVRLKIAPKDREYGILHVREESRGFFPGYGIQFILQTDMKPFIMHLTAAPNGTIEGEEIGGYLCHPKVTDIDSLLLSHVPDGKHNVKGSFLRWYDAHSLPKAAAHSWVKVYLSDSNIYRLEL